MTKGSEPVVAKPQNEKTNKTEATHAAKTGAAEEATGGSSTPDVVMAEDLSARPSAEAMEEGSAGRLPEHAATGPLSGFHFEVRNSREDIEMEDAPPVAHSSSLSPDVISSRPPSSSHVSSEPPPAHRSMEGRAPDVVNSTVAPDVIEACDLTTTPDVVKPGGWTHSHYFENTLPKV